jgi:hypothetical protein
VTVHLDALNRYKGTKLRLCSPVPFAVGLVSERVMPLTPTSRKAELC